MAQQQTTVVKLEGASLASISLASKIPEFWTDQPRVWFIQLEAILAPQKQGDTSKFNLVVSKLGKEVIQQVTDILVNPPEERKYEALKESLLGMYEESAIRQIQKLIGEMELGDQNPAIYSGRCRIWPGLLPAAARGVLAATEAKDLDRLAVIADKVMESMKSQPVAEVSAREETPGTSSMAAQLAKITARLDQMDRCRHSWRGRRGRGGFRGRSRSRGGEYSKSRRTPDSPDWLCVHHYKYRQRANRCEQPCSWKKNPEN
nr:uncharacterized protein LOC117995755 [Maniola hyperantus]